MRTLFGILFVLSVSLGSAAPDCARLGFWVHPSKQELPRNAHFIVSGYGMARGVIDSLGDEYPVYLEGDGHQVGLRVKERNKGYNIDQAFLTPAGNLRAGERYRLRIPDLGEREATFLMYHSYEEKERVWPEWEVREEKDLEAPEWEAEPELLETRYEPLGCGPAVNTVFRIEAEDPSGIWVRVELKRVESGVADHHILALRDGDLVVGHGMCSGEFSYQKGGEYQARFKLLDRCGNEGKEWSEWIRFDSPVPDG